MVVTKTTLGALLAAAAAAAAVPLAAASMPKVGIMYEGWHAPAVQAIEDCVGCARPLTIEAVLRSNRCKRQCCGLSAETSAR